MAACLLVIALRNRSEKIQVSATVVIYASLTVDRLNYKTYYRKGSILISKINKYSISRKTIHIALRIGKYIDNELMEGFWGNTQVIFVFGANDQHNIPAILIFTIKV